MRLVTLAPGKVNLCLFVGRPRADGLHPLVSIVQPVSLADELVLEPAERDEVVCPGVEGPNLAARALGAVPGGHRLGRAGAPDDSTSTSRSPPAWAAGPATPRPRCGWRPPPRASRCRASSPRAWAATCRRCWRSARTLVTGAGEQVEPLGEEPLRLGARGGEHLEPLTAGPLGLVILPSEHGLSTAEVYRRADELGVREDLAPVEAEVRAGARSFVNDLEPAARSLCPSIDDALAEVRAMGAEHVMVSGSGPTVFGLFADLEQARAAVAGHPRALVAGPAPRRCRRCVSYSEG